MPLGAIELVLLYSVFINYFTNFVFIYEVGTVICSSSGGVFLTRNSVGHDIY